MTTADGTHSAWLTAAWRFGSLASVGLLYGGLGLTPFRPTAGVLIALASTVLLFLVHLTGGIAGYRAAMRRDWPVVAPLDDEDEW